MSTPLLLDRYFVFHRDDGMDLYVVKGIPNPNGWFGEVTQKHSGYTFRPGRPWFFDPSKPPSPSNGHFEEVTNEYILEE